MKKIKTNATIWALALLVATSAFTASCNKYDDDIDSLRQGVAENKTAIAELKSALKTGAYVTAVESTATGTKFTFSDGNTTEIANPEQTDIRVKNGVWEMSTDGKQTYTPIKDQDGKISESVSLDADGYLVIGTTKTAIKTSNEVPVVVNVDGRYMLVKLEGETLTIPMSAALSVIILPQSGLTFTLDYKKISTTAIIGDNTYPSGSIISSGEMAITALPASADLSAYNLQLVDENGDALPVVVTSLTRGVDLSTYATMGATYGLWTVKFKATEEIAAAAYKCSVIASAAMGNTETQVISSPFDFDVTVAVATGSTPTAVAATLNGSTDKGLEIKSSADAFDTQLAFDGTAPTGVEITPIGNIVNGQPYTGGYLVSLVKTKTVAPENISARLVYTELLLDGTYKTSKTTVTFVEIISSDMVANSNYTIKEDASPQEVKLAAIADFGFTTESLATWATANQEVAPSVAIYVDNSKVASQNSEIAVKLYNSDDEELDYSTDGKKLADLSVIGFTLDESKVKPGTYKVELSGTAVMGMPSSAKLIANFTVENGEVTAIEKPAKPAEGTSWDKDGILLTVAGTVGSPTFDIADAYKEYTKSDLVAKEASLVNDQETIVSGTTITYVTDKATEVREYVVYAKLAGNENNLVELTRLKVAFASPTAKVELSSTVPAIAADAEKVEIAWTNLKISDAASNELNFANNTSYGKIKVALAEDENTKYVTLNKDGVTIERSEEAISDASATVKYTVSITDIWGKTVTSEELGLVVTKKTE